ncbi:sensor histidine kinase [Spongiactinospora sp. TRM90649]|uniref:sensor histidine kinase n=1 Tax=Spongiactinospora sp. TRM90649 TaxID=3031114 RepID=UPI0023FA0168|nr:sensor histidine kinase [Spongiactinospora sp. TRM90649]MDF5755113.1 sensor histidine kinase [Spongiactinospora sp. TRM90649]
MPLSRPVPWVSPVLYGAVLVAGLYAWLAGLGDTRPVLFTGGLAALALLDLLERRRYPDRTPPWPAAALLGARIALFAAVAAADGSELSRALFVLVPFTAYFAFGRTVACVLAVACALALTAAGAVAGPRWYADVEQVSDLLMFGVGLVLTVTMAAVAVEERRLRADLAASTAKVAELSATAERNRVARDIHDDLGHHLTAIAVLLEKATAFRDRNPGAADRAILDAHDSARRALDNVRRSVRTLREERPFNLSEALADLVAGQAGDDGLAVHLEFAGEESGHGTAALRALYRAAQEGITNARRHAHATRVSVTAALDAAGATLVVRDDGRGFTPGREGYGLLGMRERVQAAGGRVDIGGADAGGTVLTVTIPRRAEP